MRKEEKIKLLVGLSSEIENDEALAFRDARLVFGEGNPDAEVMFIGEAPGANEDRLGRPFVGQAGKLLDKLIEEVGWEREDVYITNIVKRRPPGNRDPLPDEVAAYAPYLTRQIEVINPKIIVPLGRFAANYFVPLLKISRDQGKILWWNENLVIPLYHPAAGLRSGAMLEDLKKSFKKLPIALKKFEEIKSERKSSQDKGDSKETEQKKLF